MIKVKVIQNREFSYNEDDGRVVSYDMDQTLVFTFESMDDAHEFIDTCVEHGEKTRVEITKED